MEKAYFSGPKEFFANADALFRTQPVRHLTIHAYQSSNFDETGLRRLAAMPELARLRALLLWDHQHVSLAGWTALFTSPYLANLQTLSVANCVLGEDEATALANAPPMAGLATLDLTSNCIGVAGAQALVASPYLSGLRVLYLGENFYGYEAEAEDQAIAALEARFGDGLCWEDPDDDI
jgi:hypothetical protein